MMKRVLIVGGYGTFGGRLIELLENTPELTILVGGRSLSKAQAYCARRAMAKAKLIPVLFDRQGDLPAQLKQLEPQLVVDASGPFQEYGEQAYSLAGACISLEINYLDLADGSQFVDGIAALDSAAKQAGVFVLSGVSSFPVLTAAVVRRLAANMAHVQSIQGGIAPSPYAGVGTNVLRAIASYAGQSLQLNFAGKMHTAYPLTSVTRETIAPPGRIPLRNVLFSMVDVPDLRVLARIYPEASSIWMGAGPVPEILHRALIALAWLVRLRIIRSLRPLAPLMEWATQHLRWGEHRGGMFVRVEGKDEAGKTISNSWHLLAEGSDGPLIPSMAAEAIIRAWIGGRAPVPGARAAISDLELSDYDKLFKTRTIFTGFREEGTTSNFSLYKQILASALGTLPPAIQQLHNCKQAEGEATIRNGHNWLARLIVKLIGFPSEGEKIPVHVRFERDPEGEKWIRRFANKSFSSYQHAGHGKSSRLLVEHFGPLAFAMALTVDGEKLQLVLRRWSFLGLPLPMSIAPRADAYETIQNDRFIFNVEISHWLTGLIVHYRGWLLCKS